MPLAIPNCPWLCPLNQTRYPELDAIARGSLAESDLLSYWRTHGHTDTSFHKDATSHLKIWSKWERIVVDSFVTTIVHFPSSPPSDKPTRSKAIFQHCFSRHNFSYGRFGGKWKRETIFSPTWWLPDGQEWSFKQRGSHFSSSLSFRKKIDLCFWDSQ